MNTLNEAPLKSPRRFLLPTVLGVGAFLIGMGVGGASSTPVPEATPTPAPTVTKTVTEQITPVSCLEALDYADQGFVAGGEAMQAIVRGDYATAQDQNAFLTQTVPKYQKAKAECRASAQ